MLDQANPFTIVHVSERRNRKKQMNTAIQFKKTFNRDCNEQEKTLEVSPFLLSIPLLIITILQTISEWSAVNSAHEAITLSLNRKSATMNEY